MEEATWSQTFLKKEYILNTSSLVTPPHPNKTKYLTILRTLGHFWGGERKRNLKRKVEECEKLLLSPNGKKPLKSWIRGRKGDGGEGLLNYKDTLLKKAQALGEGS